MRIFIVLAVVLNFISLSCTKECKPQMARCYGSTVQICRPDGKWARVADCSKVSTTTWDCKCTDTKTCRCCKPAK